MMIRRVASRKSTDRSVPRVAPQAALCRQTIAQLAWRRRCDGVHGCGQTHAEGLDRVQGRRRLRRRQAELADQGEGGQQGEGYASRARVTCT